MKYYLFVGIAAIWLALLVGERLDNIGKYVGCPETVQPNRGKLDTLETEHKKYLKEVAW